MTSTNFTNKSAINLYGTAILVSGNKNDYKEIERLLKKIDAYIIWIQNNMELTDYINKTRYLNLKHIILMDIGAETEDTIKKCKEIKMIYKNIPVIAIITHEKISENLNAIKENFDEVMIKPLTFPEMWSSISKAITHNV